MLSLLGLVYHNRFAFFSAYEINKVIIVRQLIEVEEHVKCHAHVKILLHYIQLCPSFLDLFGVTNICLVNITL